MQNMEVILDTNFVVELVKQKIDFSELEVYGKITIPRQVIEELKKLEDKDALLALKIIEHNKDKINVIEIDRKYVDLGIKRYIEGKSVIVATLDKKLKIELAGRARILTIQGRKKLILL